MCANKTNWPKLSQATPGPSCQGEWHCQAVLDTKNITLPINGHLTSNTHVIIYHGLIVYVHLWPIPAQCWGWPPSNTCPPEIVISLFECLLTIYLSLFINISTFDLWTDLFWKFELITSKHETGDTLWGYTIPMTKTVVSGIDYQCLSARTCIFWGRPAVSKKGNLSWHCLADVAVRGCQGYWRTIWN